MLTQTVSLRLGSRNLRFLIARNFSDRHSHLPWSLFDFFNLRSQIEISKSSVAWTQPVELCDCSHAVTTRPPLPKKIACSCFVLRILCFRFKVETQSTKLVLLKSFPVVVSRGSHPFPSRTRK